MIALSIRQPYAELILRGIKTYERRSTNTKIRSRVLIYASKTKSRSTTFTRYEINPEECITGFIVGSIEIVDSYYENGHFFWKLAKPKRLTCPYKPMKHPQPVWFYPV